MTDLSGKADGPVEAPSSLTLAELLQLLTMGGHLTLRVGDPVSATTLTATATPAPPITSSPLAPTAGGITPSPATSGGRDGDGGVAVAAATVVPATISAATKPSLTCASCVAAVVATPDNSPIALDGNLNNRRREPITISDSEDDDSEDDEEEEIPGTRWYAISKGRQVGVFAGWHVVAPLVVSVSGACFARYTTWGLAVSAFARALNDGNVMVIP